MTPMWRAATVVGALLLGFFLPILLLIFLLGIMDLGPVAITGLIALACAVTLIVLAARGRLRF
jgi:hypothetical protein